MLAKGMMMNDFLAPGTPTMRVLTSFMRPRRNARNTAMRNEFGSMPWRSMWRLAAKIHLPAQ
eukprot:6885368-Lingulodinium_polyedra.AAC.1